MKKSIKKYFEENRGFTLIEMVVVISLFAIMASMVLFRYNDYVAQINLENTAQDIALQIQQAENYSIGGRYPSLPTNTELPPPTDWRPSYGVVFTTSYPNKFMSFFDRESVEPSDPNFALLNVLGNSNGRGFVDDFPLPFTSTTDSCGSVPSSECLDVLTITGNISIDKLCHGTMADCGQIANQFTALTLNFTRPFPDRFALSNAIGLGINYSQSPNVIHDDVRIRIKSDSISAERDIVVSALGQIHIETVQ